MTEQTTPPKIVIVDDDRVMRAVLGTLIKNEGYDLAGEAGDGREAVKQYLLLQPDIIFMDVEMPVVDGIAALKAIRAYGTTCQVVIVSATATQSIVSLAIENGAAGFLVKPISAKKIHDAIVSCVKRAREERGEMVMFL